MKIDELYKHDETRALVALVNDAAEVVRTKGEAAFDEFAVTGSRWRSGETYIFVLNPLGGMLVHPDPALEGRNKLGLKDISGRPIIQGLLGAATASAAKADGWYHYQWPVPGAILPRWKSSYVRLVSAPSSHRYIVGSGMYNDRMERAFVVDVVEQAVAEIERNGENAYPLFHDPAGPFMAKDAYVFVIGMDGVDLVNPAFPNLERRNLLDVTDSRGKPLIREMLEVIRTSGSGWVDYMWPKPGESVPSHKSAYVTRARVESLWVLVGCGVYLTDAPTEAPPAEKMTAPELMTLVRRGAAVLEVEGEKAYPEFRREGSEWFQEDSWFSVWRTDGSATFDAADPSREGRNDSALTDILGRPIGRMILDVAAGPSGEGWVHYMSLRRNALFPAWKSAFLQRVVFPSGQDHVVGCGACDMQMDRAFIEDLVSRAAGRIARMGTDAFPELRDRTGPFVFMDTYVFVLAIDGTELVNAGLPSLEGVNLMGLRDLNGKAVAQEEIAAAMKDGSAWVDCYWYKPGRNTPARKLAYVQRVTTGQDTYIVGSGIYVD
jgi:signal transduction histidine kinase